MTATLRAYRPKSLKNSATRTVTESLALPRLIRLSPNLYAAQFAVMKMLPAQYILDRAERKGRLRPGSLVVESTSGTFALALGILCRERGYRLTVVSDDAMDAPLERRLKAMGASVDIIRTAGNSQPARIARVRELLATNPDSFWPEQYHNPDNCDAYARLARFLRKKLGRIDAVVGPVGTAGSMCGTGKHLRRTLPELRMVAVDTFGSVLFGQPNHKRRLRGLGNSMIPRCLDHRMIDEVHWVTAPEAFLATRQLDAETGCFPGPTSGAAYLAAKWWAERYPERKVVVIFPDQGTRYQHTVYNEEWLQSEGLYQDHLPNGPRLVRHPGDAGPSWSRLMWNRRSLEAVADSLPNGRFDAPSNFEWTTARAA